MNVRPVGALALALLVAGAVSCAEEDPRYGPPGSIKDRGFGGGGGSSGGGADGGGGKSDSLFKKPYNAADPPPAGDPLIPRHPYRALDDKVDCIECHKAGGTAAAKAWAFGGRVNAKNGTPIREVIVTSDKGDVLGFVKATSDGFFWAPGAPVAGARTAVRTEKGEEAEMGTPAGGSCNAGGSCHGGATGPIVVPK